MTNKKLYLVKSRAFRAYVVAESADGAWEKFESWLKENDYGCYTDCDFDSVEIVAKTDAYSPKSNTGTSFDDSRKDDMLFL